MLHLTPGLFLLSRPYLVVLCGTLVTKLKTGSLVPSSVKGLFPLKQELSGNNDTPSATIQIGAVSRMPHGSWKPCDKIYFSLPLAIGIIGSLSKVQN